MARLPIYEQQVGSKSNSVTPQEMGAGVGQAMGQVGSVVQDLGITIQRRDDRLEMTKRVRMLDESARNLQEAAEIEDMTNPDVVDTLKKTLQSQADNLVGSFKGLGESRAAFKEQVENQIYQYTKQIDAAKTKATYKMINSDLEAVQNDSAIEIMYAPDAVDGILQKVNSRIDYWAPTLPAEVVDAYRTQITSSTLARGLEMLVNSEKISDVEKAESLMQDPKYSQFLDPQQSGQLGVKIAVTKGKITKRGEDRVNNLRQWQALGVQITPDNMLLLQDTEVGNDGQGLLRYSILTGKQVTPDMIDRQFKMTSDLSETARGRIMEAMPRLDMMNETEIVGVLADVQKAFPSEVRKDEQGNIRVMPNPALLRIPKLARLMGFEPTGSVSSQSMPADGGPVISSVVTPEIQETAIPYVNGQPIQGNPNPGDMVELRDATGKVLGSGVADERGMFNIRTSGRGASGSWAEGAQQEQANESMRRPPREEGIFQKLRSVGIMKGIAATAAQIPIEGVRTEGGVQALQDRPEISGMVNEMISALRENSRYPSVEESKRLMEEFGKLKSEFNNPKAAQDIAYGIYKTLNARLEHQMKVSKDVSLHIDVRNDAQKNISSINHIIDRLKVVEVDTYPEMKKAIEDKKLYIGDVFFTARGERRVVTQERYNRAMGVK